MFTIENFITGMQTCMQNITIRREEDCLKLIRTSRFSENGTESTIEVGTISTTELHLLNTELSNDFSFNDCILSSSAYLEEPVKLQDRMRGMPYRNFERNMYQCNEHSYDFSITKASDKFVFSLFCYIAEHPERNFEVSIINHSMTRGENISNIDDLANYLRILTTKVLSPRQHTLAEYKHMMQSYLFNVSYNYNIVFSVTNLLEEDRMFRRGVRRTGQLFPYKNYKSELTKYYYQASSTDIPFTQYLAYYHVAEFFFQTIAENDAFQEIENFITRPSFSPRKKEDIKQFYNKIKKKMRDQREDGVWDEKTGLLLTLKKYSFDIGNLKAAIVSIDSTALDYYKNNDVEFADDGKRINFDDISEQVYISIRNRVYAVRNAIVHSKDGDRLRYEPFKHDKQLAKEIPLIRAIAEEIIINSSKAIEWNFDA